MRAREGDGGGGFYCSCFWEGWACNGGIPKMHFLLKGLPYRVPPYNALFVALETLTSMQTLSPNKNPNKNTNTPWGGMRSAIQHALTHHSWEGKGKREQTRTPCKP